MNSKTSKNIHIKSLLTFSIMICLITVASINAQNGTGTPSQQGGSGKKFIVRGGKGNVETPGTTAPAPKTTASVSKTAAVTNPNGLNVLKTSAVLMPGIATRFKCPEPPLQVVLGNQNGIEVVEGVGDTNDFFLLPQVAGMTTNMFVQFPSGTSEVKLSVNTGKIKNATYDSEINLSVANSELLQKKNSELEKQIKLLRDNLETEKNHRKKEEESNRTALEEMKAKIEPPVDIFKMFRTFRTFQNKEFTANDYRLSVLTPSIQTGKNKYSMLIEITNKDKKKPFSFKDVSFEGGEAKILNGFTELKPLETQTVEFTIELADPNPNLKLKLSGDKNTQLIPIAFIDAI